MKPKAQYVVELQLRVTDSNTGKGYPISRTVTIYGRSRPLWKRLTHKTLDLVLLEEFLND